MDTGPFGAPRPTERRTPARPQTASPEPSRQPPEIPHRTVKEESKPVYREPAQHRSAKEAKSARRFIVPLIIALAVIVLAFLGWLVWSGSKNGITGVDSSKYQAVFFTNGQVYFGKLEEANGEYLKLRNIFYLQTQDTGDSEEASKNPQQTSTQQNNVQLIKLGEEVHGPEDEMIISKDQVLFYENIKSDGKVAQLIEQYKEQ